MLISELNTGFFMVLREVQKKYPSLISDDLDVTTAFSVERSLRRGATCEALNVNIPEPIVNANNRWRKEMRANGMKPSFSMVENYCKVQALIPTLVKFSRAMPTV